MCRKEKQFDPSLQLIIAAEQDLGPTSFFLEKKYSLKGTKETEKTKLTRERDYLPREGNACGES